MYSKVLEHLWINEKKTLNLTANDLEKKKQYF